MAAAAAGGSGSGSNSGSSMVMTNDSILMMTVFMRLITVAPGRCQSEQKIVFAFWCYTRVESSRTCPFLSQKWLAVYLCETPGSLFESETLTFGGFKQLGREESICCETQALNLAHV